MAIFKKTQKDIKTELANARQELADHQAKMSAAIVEGGDVDKLAADVAKFKARITALENALPVAAAEDTAKLAVKRQAAKNEWQKHLEQTEGEIGDLLKDVYAINETAAALIANHEKARAVAYRNGYDTGIKGMEIIGLAVMVARATTEIKIRIGTGNPQLPIDNGLVPFKG